MSLPQLCVFTPAFNASKTLERTYKSLCGQTNKNFQWLIINDGSTDETENMILKWEKENIIPISHIYKTNGGLHTGYNEAICRIENELCVCVDADDFMPENAVEIILNNWKEGDKSLAGIIGLDFFSNNSQPIGGFFSDTSKACHFLDLPYKLNHYGDFKIVVRTELLKPFVPMKSFPGEKNFNPIYLFYKINPALKYRLLNENLCFVDYQANGMSANIYRQFLNSPRSFAELRKVALQHPNVPIKRKIIEAAHLVSSSILAKELKILRESPKKLLTFFCTPLGIMFASYIKFKSAKR